MLVSSRLFRLSAIPTTLVMVFALLGLTAPAAQAADTATWTGADSGLWSDPDNWTGSTPAADVVLVFPAGAARQAVVNDLPSGIAFQSITIAGSGYDLSGNALSLTRGVLATYTSGSSVIDLDVALGTGINVATGGTLSVKGAVTGTAGLGFAGGGTLALDSTANAYTGATIVGPGVLEVNGAIVSPIVLAGGTLAGSGTLKGSGITSATASTVAPGPKNAPGILSYSSNTGLTLPSNSALHVDIDGATVGTGYDQLKLTSGSALFNPNGATLDIDLGYLPAVNTSFQIVNQASSTPVTGRFNGISQFGSVTSGPVTFSVGYFNSGIILTVTSVSSRTWDGGGTTSKWSEAANWAGDTAPTAGSALVFPQGAAKRSTVNDFASGTSFASITIADAGYDLAGNAFATSFGMLADFATGTSTISSPVNVSSAVPVSVQDGGTLALSGAVSSTNGLAKTGEGLLLLSAANSYAGVTSVSAGTLAIANSSSLGSSVAGNGTNVSPGATLEIRGTINTSEPIRIVGDGDGGVGSLYNGAGNNVVQSVTLTGDASIGTTIGTFLLIPSTLAESGGAARMTKIGAGVLDVLATASYTGGTTVAAGDLAVEGTIPGPISVQSGATVSGAGGNLGDVSSVGGTVTPGFSTSPFTADARSLVLDSASKFVAQLNGTTAGNGSTGHSRLNVAEGVTLGDATLSPTVQGGYTPAPGDALTILTTVYGSVGTFKGLPEGGFVTAPGGAGRTFRISYVGGDGNDIVLTSVADSSTALTATPNPAEPGDEVTIKATVSPGSATGTVTFKDGSTTLDTVAVIAGVASLETSALALGSHAITATYNGSAAHAPSTSSALTQNIVDPPPGTAISSGPADESEGNPTTASFEFDSPDADVESFECSLDGSAFTACSSPKEYEELTGGSHTFQVRAIDAGDNVDPTPAARTWHVTGVFAVTGDVAIDGAAKVGQTLTAESSVETTPTSSSVTGQWFRGETAIPEATSTTYTLTNDDVSFEITYHQTRTRDDYETVVIESDPTSSVTGGVITLGVPTISGTPVVDGVLTATPGSVSPASASVELTWNVDGTPTGTTGTTYTVTPADVGKPVTVTATATKLDYDTEIKTSVATATVAEAVFSTGPTATLSGVFKVGEILTAGEGTPVPAPDSYAYQWFAGDAEIAGATSPTFTVQKAQKGARLSVSVTAIRVGYVDAADTSDASPIVVTNLAPDLNLTRSTTNVRLGEKTSLSWSSIDATSLTASGAWSGAKGESGTEAVEPSSTGTQTYTLTATNGSGTTTAQVAVEVALPATKLTLKARGSVKTGRKITVSTQGLAPREAYTIRIGGVKVASGKATTSGKVKRSVRVPSSVKAGKRLVRVTGSLSDRTGTRRVKVVTAKSAKTPKVTLRASSVRASDDQRITVRGLHPSEKVKVTYMGERISPKAARASAKGVYTLTFDVGTSWGRKTVAVDGARSGRSVSKQFSVVSRCAGGSYYCR